MFVNIEISNTLNYKIWDSQEHVVLLINQTIQKDAPSLKFKLTVWLIELSCNQILSNFYVSTLNKHPLFWQIYTRCSPFPHTLFIFRLCVLNSFY